MQRRRVGQGAVGAEPHVLDRVGRLRVERVFFGHRAHFDRLGAQQLVAHVLGDQVNALLGQFKLRRQVFRADHRRHAGLVLEAGFVVLERRAAGKNRVALLDRRHAACAEAAAIAHAVHRIHHRQCGIAGAQKITVQRMHVPLGFYGLAGSRQRLAEHLPAEQLAKTQVLAAAAKEVFLDRLQGQQVHQIFQYLAHRATPTIYGAFRAAYPCSVSNHWARVMRYKTCGRSGSSAATLGCSKSAWGS